MKFMEKIFYLMRHGETLFNVQCKVQGASDSPLTELGLKQAAIAADYFDDIELTHLYCSTTERASDTLEIATRNRMPYTRLKGLKERDHGRLEGEREDSHPRNQQFFDHDIAEYGGETTAEVIARIKATCIDIMEQDGHHAVLAVSHRGACSTFLRLWHDNINEIFPDGMPNCAVLKFTYTDQKFVLVDVYTPDLTGLK